MGRKGSRSRSESRLVSRRVALALIAGGGVLGVTASGSFDVVEGTRPFSIGVTDDDTALLRLVSTAHGAPSDEPLNTTVIDYIVEDGEEMDLVTIENQFGDGLEFRMLRANPDPPGWGSDDIDLTVGSEPLSMDETTTLTGTFTCAGLFARAPVELQIDAETRTGSIEATRTVNVTCLGPPDACGISGPTGDETEKTVRRCDNGQDSDGDDDDDSGGNNGQGNDDDSDDNNSGNNGHGESCTTPSGITGEYDVTVKNGGEVDGDVDVTGTVTVESGGDVYGTIRAGDTVTISNGGEFGGSIETGGSLTIEGGGRGNQGQTPSTIPEIEVCGDLNGIHGPFLDVTGDVIVGGNLHTDNGFEIGTGGNLIVRGDVCVVHGAKVDTVGRDLVVGGDLSVQSGGTVEVRGNLVVGGDLTVSGADMFDVDGSRITTGTVEMAASGVTCGDNSNDD